MIDLSIYSEKASDNAISVEPFGKFASGHNVITLFVNDICRTYKTKNT